MIELFKIQGFEDVWAKYWDKGEKIKYDSCSFLSLCWPKSVKFFGFIPERILIARYAFKGSKKHILEISNILSLYLDDIVLTIHQEETILNLLDMSRARLMQKGKIVLYIKGEK